MNSWKEPSQLDTHKKWESWTLHKRKATSGVTEIATAFSMSLVAGFVLVPIVF